MVYSYDRHSPTAPTLVMIHGFLGSPEQWVAVEKHFTPQFNILKPTLPGHDKDHKVEEYSIDSLAESLKVILEDEGIGKVVLIGHSMGGYVSCAFAKAYPAQTLGIILVNSIAEADTAERLKLRDRSIKMVQKMKTTFVKMAIGNLFSKEEREEFREVIATMKHAAGNMTMQAVIQATRAMRDRKSVTDQLRKTPVFYIYGKEDTIIPEKVVRGEAMLIATDVQALDGGHMLLLTNPKGLAARIRNCLTQLELINPEPRL